MGSTVDVPYEASVAASAFCMLGMVQALPLAKAFFAESATHGNGLSPSGLALMGFHGTPIDALLGDAAVAANGRHLLVEFKRQRDLLDTELGKPRRAAYLKMLERADVHPVDRNAVTMRAHAVVYAEARTSGPTVVAAPYAELAALLGETGSTPAAPHDLETFCRIFLGVDTGMAYGTRSLLRAKEPQWGVSLPEFVPYLSRLVAPGSTSSGDRGHQEFWEDMAGYWLVATPDGRLGGEAFHSLSELQALMARVEHGGQPPTAMLSPPHRPAPTPPPSRKLGRR